MRKSLRLALFGHPVSHSRSAELFAAHAEAQGIALDYELHDVEPVRLGESFARLRAGDWDGVNVTVPHKHAAAELVDTLDEAARSACAVNTVVRRSDGTLHGLSTDGVGFLAGLERPVRRALILGAGGAAASVSSALIQRGAAVFVVTRHVPERREWIPCRAHGLLSWQHPQLFAALGAADLVVQATPLGMEPEHGRAPDLPYEAFGPEHRVVDLVYKPWETVFLARVRERGARAINGWPMLVAQAAAALDAWAGPELARGFEDSARGVESRDPAAP